MSRLAALAAVSALALATPALANSGNPLLVNIGTLANGFGNPTFALSWTQSVGYTGVSVLALLGSSAGASGSAYLMNSIGTGTTTANEVVDPVPFTVPANGNTPGAVSLFSNLTLAAGTYYLVLQQGTGSFFWAGDGNAADAVTGTGVVAGSNYTTTGSPITYGPARSFTSLNIGLEVDIEGIPAAAAVPEPASMAVLGSALAGLMFARRRRI